MVSLALMDRALIPVGALIVGALATKFGPLLGALSMGVGCGVLTVLLVAFLPGVLRLKLVPDLSVQELPRPRVIRKVLTSSLIVCLLPWLVGCAGQAQARAQQPVVEQISVANHWGPTEVPVKPKRIVVLDLSFLDCLATLGLVPSGFAGTSSPRPPRYLRDEFSEPPLYVGERKQPNLEVIMALKPDLIIAHPRRHRLLRSQLEAMAPTIALSDDSLEEVMGNLNLLAKVTGTEDRAQRAEQKLRTQIAGLKEGLTEGTSVLVAGAFEDEFTVWTANSFVGSLFEAGGLEYAYQGPEYG